jgi:hypothetical protein
MLKRYELHASLILLIPRVCIDPFLYIPDIFTSEARVVVVPPRLHNFACTSPEVKYIEPSKTLLRSTANYGSTASFRFLHKRRSSAPS